MTKRTPRILWINDNSAQPNWGSQATPYAIRRMFADIYPEGSLDALPYTWLAGRYRVPRRFAAARPFQLRRSRFVSPIVYRLTRPYDPYPAIVDDFDYVADQWLSGKAGKLADEFIARARVADAVFYNGENSFYRNTVAGARALFLLYLCKSRLGKITCSVNHTAVLSNMTRPIMRGMAARVLPSLDFVAARETRSLQDLRDLGVENTELIPDVVFYLGDGFGPLRNTQTPAHSISLGESYFCISASALPVSEPRADWDGAFMQLVSQLKSLGVRPVLVAKDPHCLFLREIANRVGGTFFGPEHDFPELWPLFREAQFVVTGHYHYAIISAMVGCPFIPMTTNNHKMPGVCEHIGWHIIEPYDATSLQTVGNEIVAEAQRLCQSRPLYRQRLLERTRIMQLEAGRIVTRIRELVPDSEPAAAVDANDLRLSQSALASR